MVCDTSPGLFITFNSQNLAISRTPTHRRMGKPTGPLCASILLCSKKEQATGQAARQDNLRWRSCRKEAHLLPPKSHHGTRTGRKGRRGAHRDTCGCDDVHCPCRVVPQCLHAAELTQGCTSDKCSSAYIDYSLIKLLLTQKAINACIKNRCAAVITERNL